MIRALLDTNVLLDIELRRPQRLSEIKEAALDGRLDALISFRIVEELKRALDADEELGGMLHRVGRSADELVSEILSYTTFAGGFGFARKILRKDTSDEPVLAAALAGRADVLVTSNVRDFEAVSEIEVITPEELMDRI